MEETAIIIFQAKELNIEADLLVPLDITAYDLIFALNAAYGLGIDTSDLKQCYMRTERPIALLKGSNSLKQLGVRTGTVVQFAR